MDRYQDYVIKEGKFIGEFESMYQKFDNPWHQIEAVDDSYSRLSSILTLNSYGVKSVLEVGCGLGKFTNYIHEKLPNIKIVGMDISETAVKKAKVNYPDIEFITDDLASFSANAQMGGYDAILLSEIMWYILNDLDIIIQNLSLNYTGNIVIINQTFYREGQQYGREYFTNLDEMVNYLPWKLLRKISIDRLDDNGIESHSVFRIEAGEEA
jgi:SAM-dependent methyltransferase